MHVADFLASEHADIVALQEVLRHFDDSVLPMYRSKDTIENRLKSELPYTFFGPLWITEAFYKHGKIHRDFGGLVEQGNEVLSALPIVEATNEFFYKTYSYARDWTHFKTDDHARALQVVELDVNGKRLRVLNTHGIWTHDKRGDERTMAECRYILSAAQRKKLPTIIVGDFNLTPDNPGVELINKEFQNLLLTYKITSTRPSFDDGLEKGSMVVDYIFTNDLVKVHTFEVKPVAAPDHFPLVLDFDII